jgi:hypothetical protein
VSAAPSAARSQAAAAPAHPPKAASLAQEPLPLDLPILRNFRPSQPALETTGIDAELSGVDFLLDHGLLDEARMRVEQLAHEHPGHPGVGERRARLDAAGPRPALALTLSLDDDWGSPATTPEPPPVAPPRPPADVASPVPVVAKREPSPETAEELVCSVFCPLAVDEGDAFDVRVWIHRTSETEADGVAIVEDRREAAVLKLPVSEWETLTLSLSLPLFEIDGFPAVPLVWNGSATSVAFRVRAPHGTAESQVEGWLTVEREGESMGDVALRIRVA